MASLTNRMQKAPNTTKTTDGQGRKKTSVVITKEEKAKLERIALLNHRSCVGQVRKWIQENHEKLPYVDDQNKSQLLKNTA